MDFINVLSLSYFIIFQSSSIAAQFPTVINATFGTSSVQVIGCVECVATDSLKPSSDTIPDTIPIWSFKGMRFAETPIRFQKPVAKDYTGITTIDATNYKNPCIGILPVDNPLPSGVPVEDCLYLNVWTPTLNSSANLPVMIWIYGGAFILGSSSQQISGGSPPSISSTAFDGSQLSLRNVVIVSFNYRLSLFGFLYGNSTEAPGNIGLWDQAMAINWTRQYISNFGGNPNDITLFGESAGSMSISNHIISPITRNWFQKAIMESGTSYLKYISNDRDTAYAFARQLGNFPTIGCTDANTLITCLKSKLALDLYLALTAIFLTEMPSLKQLFTTIYGDEFMPMSVPDALKSGNFNKNIKIIFGHNEMEGTLLLLLNLNLQTTSSGRYVSALQTPIFSRIDVKSDIGNKMIPNSTISQEIALKYTKDFPLNSLSLIPYDLTTSNSIRRAAVHAYSDYIIVCPTILFGANFFLNCGKNNTVYQYRLTYTTSKSICKESDWCDATHTDDLPLVFGQPFKPIDDIIWTDEDRFLSKQMMDIWTYFAKYGQPPIVNSNTWPPYTLKTDGNVSANYLELHANLTILGRTYMDRYRGNNVYSNGDYFFPSCINDCFGLMNEELLKEFGILL